MHEGTHIPGPIAVDYTHTSITMASDVDELLHRGPQTSTNSGGCAGMWHSAATPKSECEPSAKAPPHGEPKCVVAVVGEGVAAPAAYSSATARHEAVVADLLWAKARRLEESEYLV